MVILILLCVPAASAVAESESNNTYATADTTTDDTDNTGTMSSATDVDWWKVTFNQDGWANYWLGNIKSGNDFDLALYDSNGTTLLESSENSSNSQELIRYNVVKNRTYYIKITAYIVNASTAKTYEFRTKVYDVESVYAFTYNYTEIDDGVSTLRDNRLPNSTMQLLWNMGYDNSQYINNSADGVYNSLSKAHVFLFHNHGFPGGVQAYAASTNTTANIYAKGSSVRNISTGPSLSKARLVIWMGCDTADTSTTYGNLVDETLNKGAAAAIGWYNETYSEPIANDWLRGFFDAAGDGEKLTDCLDAADLSIKAEYYDNADDITKYTNMLDWYTGSSNLNGVIG